MYSAKFWLISSDMLVYKSVTKRCILTQNSCEIISVQADREYYWTQLSD